MKIAFSPPKAKIVAVVIAACMIYSLIQTHVGLIAIDICLPALTQPYLLAALIVVAALIMVLYKYR